MIIKEESFLSFTFVKTDYKLRNIFPDLFKIKINYEYFKVESEIKYSIIKSFIYTYGRKKL